MRSIMRAVRAVLGPILLLLDALFQPTAIVRTEEGQAKVESETAHLKLYQFQACPFCVRVRRGMKRLALPIETRDTKRNEQWREELLSEGGSPKVPCLRIEGEGEVRWLYESKAINEYLESRFAV